MRFSAFISLLCIANVAFAAPKPGDFYVSGKTQEKIIALTFDDGPGPHTGQFLDLLDRYGVKATFFMLGEQVKNKPTIAKRVQERGHEIADHTTRHTNYLKKLKELNGDVSLAKQELLADMKKSQEQIKKTTAVDVTLCRMPHGIDRPWIKEVAKEAGVILVNWTYGADWTGESVGELEKGYIKAIKPGAILLFHDGWPKADKSLALTEAVLKAAQEKGYKIVPVGQLLGN